MKIKSTFASRNFMGFVPIFRSLMNFDFELFVGDTVPTVFSIQ